MEMIVLSAINLLALGMWGGRLSRLPWRNRRLSKVSDHRRHDTTELQHKQPTQAWEHKQAA
jgi:hypothetical protein